MSVVISQPPSEFPRDVTGHHGLACLHNRNLQSHSSGGWQPKVKVSAGLAPSGALAENPFPASPPASEVYQHPPPSQAQRRTTDLCISLCTCVSKWPLSVRTPGWQLRPTLMTSFYLNSPVETLSPNPNLLLSGLFQEQGFQVLSALQQVSESSLLRLNDITSHRWDTLCVSPSI